MLLVIDVNRGQLVLYDSCPLYISMEDITLYLMPLSYMLSSIAEFCNLHGRKPDLALAL